MPGRDLEACGTTAGSPRTVFGSTESQWAGLALAMRLARAADWRTASATVVSFLAARPHLARYAVVGLLCTGFQLVLFTVLLRRSVPSSVANTLAFLLSTQLNFALSHRFTWAHRRGATPLPRRRLLARCLAYNAAAAVGLGVNAAVFFLAHTMLVLSALVSATVAVAASTAVNYLLSSRVIFTSVAGASSAPRASSARPGAVVRPGATAQPWARHPAPVPGAPLAGAGHAPAYPGPGHARPPAGDGRGRPSGSPRPADRRPPLAPRAAALPALAHDARVTATRCQRWVVLSLAALLVLVLAAAAVGVRTPLLVVVGLVTTLYLADMLFCAYLMTGSMRRDNRTPAAIPHELEWWPAYTVLCPMYRETAVLPQFVAAITKLDYPAESLQVLLLLEEDDHDTIDFARGMDLPGSFEIVVVPDSQPKTKPKACNYGLHVARGDYVVIFDAEDVPEPDQLKKAVLAFAELPGAVACLQAPLNFYNPRQNVLTRLFTAEYSLWFDLMLVGLQRLRGPIPLGGTSNHFRVEVLRGLGAWDPYNVTEDADLGIRLYKQGFRTGMLDSTTYEEANPDPRNWIRQRSRWIKGYLQTLLVHTRGGWDLRHTRDPHFFTFLLVIGGKAMANFINPLMWAATVSYFLFRASIGPTIKALYPAPVFYAAVVTLAFGNLLFVYTFLLGSARRGNYDLIKYGLLAPLYWLMMSAAAGKALTQLIRNPHYWEKTKHGLHLDAGADQTAVRHDNELVLR
jgi:cellulose synthase/poly-beta-1,6-N-acetylglucosamine synthase-like glycosyltransferase/putative flippase GtrA